MESLESRRCLATVNFFPELGMLAIDGDGAANDIRIRSTSADDVRVVADGRDYGAFRGIETLRIRTAGGRDFVDVSLGATFPYLSVALGQGDDRLNVTVADPAGADPAVDPPEPDRVGRIRIDAGAGDDFVDVNLGATFPYLSVALGQGDDRLNVTVADPAGADPAVGDPAVDPPEPDRVGRIRIDAGAGDDFVKVRLPHDRYFMDIDMGSGDDVLQVIVGDRSKLGGGR